MPGDGLIGLVPPGILGLTTGTRGGGVIAAEVADVDLITRGCVCCGPDVLNGTLADLGTAGRRCLGLRFGLAEAVAPGRGVGVVGEGAAARWPT